MAEELFEFNQCKITDSQPDSIGQLRLNSLFIDDYYVYDEEILPRAKEFMHASIEQRVHDSIDIIFKHIEKFSQEAIRREQSCLPTNKKKIQMVSRGTFL